MHEQTLKLAALWAREQERDALLAERAGLEAGVRRQQRQLADARALATSTASQLKALQEEERRRTERMNVAAKRRDTTQRLIDEGRASDYAAAMKQVELSKAVVDEEEDALLPLYDQLDAAQTAATGAVSGVKVVEGRLREAEAKLAERAPGVAEALVPATASRDAARDGIHREWLNRYDDLRKKNMGVFGDVRDGVCQGCSVKLVPTELAEHRRGVATHYCKSCGRFLGELL